MGIICVSFTVFFSIFILFLLYPSFGSGCTNPNDALKLPFGGFIVISTVCTYFVSIKRLTKSAVNLTPALPRSLPSDHGPEWGSIDRQPS